MDRFGNIIIEDREVENERFEMTDKIANYILGPNLTLRNCTLILKVPASRLCIDQARFIDCTFEVKQELNNHQEWVKAFLKGCRFKGKLAGCDFGHWPEYGSEPGYQTGFIEDCDFTEARLNGCRFMDCDPRTLRFPKWPCFTLLDPIGRAAELNRVSWPGLVGPVIMEELHTQPARTRALTEHAPTLAKKLETTPEAIRAVIEQFDCIVF